MPFLKRGRKEFSVVNDRSDETKMRQSNSSTGAASGAFMPGKARQMAIYATLRGEYGLRYDWVTASREFGTRFCIGTNCFGLGLAVAATMS